MFFCVFSQAERDVAELEQELSVMHDQIEENTGPGSAVSETESCFHPYTFSHNLHLIAKEHTGSKSEKPCNQSCSSVFLKCCFP